MRKPTWLRSLIVPASILAILFVAFVAYYMYWVPSRQRLLDDRGFRYLKTLSDQIRLSMNTYDRMMDNAMNSGVIEAWIEEPQKINEDATRSNLQKFLANVAPQLALVDGGEADTAVGKNGYEDPPKIAVKADEGTHFLYFAFRHELPDKFTGQRTFDFALRTDLDQAINRLLGAPNLSPFDVVLVAQGDGKVIFQRSLSGVEVAQITGLEDASGVLTKDKERKQFAIGWLSPASRQEEIWIAGARYRLYSQPLQVGFVGVDPTGKQSTNASESWVLCGLVRADRFRAESQLIPYSYILMMLAAILLMASSYPFLKLYLTAPGERLRTRDVTLVAVFACVVAAVVTFILADSYFWNRSFGPAAEKDMAKLAHAMSTNFQLERELAWSTLDSLRGEEELKKSLHEAADHSGRDIKVCYAEDTRSGAIDCLKKEVTCEPQSACKADILLSGEHAPSPLEKYPYALFAYWSDLDGKQQIKWTTRKRPTPFINLSDGTNTFYPQIKRALKRQVESPVVPTQGIGSQYSSTTGQNVTTFWKVFNYRNPIDEKPGEYRDVRFTQAMVTQPISVYRAVLPGGYQFAILTPDGQVVFHSDSTRNLRENFFAETSENPGLRSLVRMRSEGSLTATYLGRPHRMFVAPMDAGNQDGLWTIVIFRDLHLEEVLNLEILSLVTILFVIYVAAIVLIMVAVHLLHKGKAARWFWPDSRKTQQYQRIALVAVGTILLLLLLSRFLSPFFLVVVSAILPAVGLVSAVAIVRHRDGEHSADTEQDQARPDRWKFAYFLAAATLVLLVAVMPCLCFFKVAASYGQWLLVKRNVLQLAGDFDNRALTLQSLYQDVNLGDFGPRILAGPETQRAGLLDGNTKSPSLVLPVFSYHELLATKVSSEGPLPAGLIADTSDESTLLSVLSYPYNETAADDRHLAEGKSDVWKWSTGGSGSNREVTLTKLAGHGTARTITVTWQPFQFPWLNWLWLLGAGLFAVGVYFMMRVSFTRIFLLNLESPPLAKSADPELDPARLIADLPMNLLVIGPDTSQQIGALLHRSDVQVREAEELLIAAPSASTQPTGGATPVPDPIESVIRDGRAVVIHNFERLSDKDETAVKAYAALTRILSSLGNSVIIISSVDPVEIASIEASERWRTLLRSFVRIDLHATPRQRRDEDDADYQSRISAGSYFHWLFAGLPRNEKLIMFQLAKEKIVNPNSYEIVYELLEQGLIERKHGLLTVADPDFKHFLPHALPHHTVKLWEKELAGSRPFSLQTSLLILGVGVVAFLVYTQGDVFNTWVTYATGVAAAVPKALQFFENFHSKPQSKS